MIPCRFLPAQSRLKDFCVYISKSLKTSVLTSIIVNPLNYDNPSLNLFKTGIFCEFTKSSALLLRKKKTIPIFYRIETDCIGKPFTGILYAISYSGVFLAVFLEGQILKEDLVTCQSRVLKVTVDYSIVRLINKGFRCKYFSKGCRILIIIEETILGKHLKLI